MLVVIDLTVSKIRSLIKNYYVADEATVIKALLKQADFSADFANQNYQLAKAIIQTSDGFTSNNFTDTMLHNYKLSSREGKRLLEVAEALLRIPDKQTAQALIEDKLKDLNWKMNQPKGVFSSMLATCLNVTTNILKSESLFGSNIKKLSTPIILSSVKKTMGYLSKKFVLTEEIINVKKIINSQSSSLFSFDMLGEAAITHEDSKKYFDKYHFAIETVGKLAKKDLFVHENHGVSLKLSALYPRFEHTHKSQAIKALVASLTTLCKLAADYNIPITIDMEESYRLEMSLDIMEELYQQQWVQDWQGLGMVVQAYQKRAPFMLDFLISLGKQYKCKVPIRLVKGAYWDMEIKQAQVKNLEDYPVFTKKAATDLSYLVCARKMLESYDYIYCQFATHNALSMAQICNLAKPDQCFEFQRLHGMGEKLFKAMVENVKNEHIKYRIYAPVGHYEDLLPYLVRRLLENGANSSFVNYLEDQDRDLDQLLADPITTLKQEQSLRHEMIKLPKDIYPTHINSKSIDLDDDLQANPLISHTNSYNFYSKGVAKDMLASFCPYDNHQVVGAVKVTDPKSISQIIDNAQKGWQIWSNTPITQRVDVLNKAAKLLEESLPELVSLCCHEAGKTPQDGIDEVREAVDFCRYYAHQAAKMFDKPQDLGGPVGEKNTLEFTPKGIFMCISPWNFPLAIFMGQITAALATGNGVIAKPASQTPLIAKAGIDILHKAGVPKDVLQLVIGSGSKIATPILSHEAIVGVAFTGSTQTAHHINRTIAQKSGVINTLIAETGGQNAMMIDSSALLEQAVTDVINSAFRSAGQRCSALRVCYVQSDIYEAFCQMLKGAMACLNIGNPTQLVTDIGPVIDQSAQKILQDHKKYLKSTGSKLIFECDMDTNIMKSGSFVAPAVFEIPSIKILKQEVFGPILHVIKYTDEKSVIDEINSTGFGLTFGIHSRIDSKTQAIATQIKAGNIYINRNTIGAVVGIQPFGGQGLSGTGPKAGGPHYLYRFVLEKTSSIDTTAQGGNASLLAIV